MATDLGKVGMVTKGTWNSASTYEVLDVVSYNNGVYIAKQAVPANTLPTNTTYWQEALNAVSQEIDGDNLSSITDIFNALKDNPFFAYITANVGAQQSTNMKTLIGNPGVGNYVRCVITIEHMVASMAVLNVTALQTSNTASIGKLATKKLWLQGSNRTITGQSAWTVWDFA